MDSKFLCIGICIYNIILVGFINLFDNLLSVEDMRIKLKNDNNKFRQPIFILTINITKILTVFLDVLLDTKRYGFA